MALEAENGGCHLGSCNFNVTKGTFNEIWIAAVYADSCAQLVIIGRRRICLTDKRCNNWGHGKGREQKNERGSTAKESDSLFGRVDGHHVCLDRNCSSCQVFPRLVSLQIPKTFESA